MIRILLITAALLQAIAVGYGLVLLRRHGAARAWWFLLGAMLSMLVWRLVVMTDAEPPVSFTLVIAIWGSTCMLAAMYSFGQEMTRRQRAESERDALLRSERLARQEAEQASRVKDEFLANLSHELRTPLTAILGWCTLISLKRHQPEDVARGLETIQRNAQSQVRLVDDLLDATRIQAGKLLLEFTPVRLDGPVTAAIDAISPAAAAKRLRLTLELEGEAPTVTGDALRLQQITANLLSNAVKFTPAGGAVRVCITADGGKAHIVVADTGAGISADFLPHLFTRFRQADGSSARRYGGLGLGLSIADSLARLHNGVVTAASEGPGLGATFTVTLPMVAYAGATGTLPRKEAGDEPLNGVRILIIDDEADLRAVLGQVLTEMGALIVTADSGAGVEAMLLASPRPQVLIVDISMPGEDGYMLIRRIRSLPAPARDVPAIALTAHARLEDRQQALAAGFNEHLAKPFDLPAVVATVRALATSASTASTPVAVEATGPSHDTTRR